MKQITEMLESISITKPNSAKIDEFFVDRSETNNGNIKNSTIRFSTAIRGNSITETNVSGTCDYAVINPDTKEAKCFYFKMSVEIYIDDDCLLFRFASMLKYNADLRSLPPYITDDELAFLLWKAITVAQQFPDEAQLVFEQVFPEVSFSSADLYTLICDESPYYDPEELIDDGHETGLFDDFFDDPDFE